jgi:hypothetical protein
MTTINLPTSNATINNLTVNGALTLNGALTQNRMFVRYDNPGGQNSAPGTTAAATTLQFSTATTSVNATGLTVSGAGNTTFTNTSGNAQYWVICATTPPTNNDAGTQKLGLKLYINGTPISGMSYYVTAGGIISLTVTTPLLMNNNDALTVVFVQTSNTVMTIGAATLFIMQV